MITEKLAVMFYIHGGGFFEGSGNDDFLGPDFLINEDVILVNYYNFYKKNKFIKNNLFFFNIGYN